VFLSLHPLKSLFWTELFMSKEPISKIYLIIDWIGHNKHQKRQKQHPPPKKSPTNSTTIIDNKIILIVLKEQKFKVYKIEKLKDGVQVAITNGDNEKIALLSKEGKVMVLGLEECEKVLLGLRR